MALDPCSGTGAALQAHIAFLVGAQKPGSQIVGIGLRQLVFRTIARAETVCQVCSRAPSLIVVDEAAREAGRGFEALRFEFEGGTLGGG